MTLSFSIAYSLFFGVLLPLANANAAAGGGARGFVATLYAPVVMLAVVSIVDWIVIRSLIYLTFDPFGAVEHRLLKSKLVRLGSSFCCTSGLVVRLFD